MNNKYLEAIEKLALGYEYEEVQTLIEETTSGTKKKVMRNKKHMPPNFQAATYLIKRNNKSTTSEEQFDKLHKFSIEKF